MEFIKGQCPLCKGNLQIPADREKIICMYCGNEILTQEAALGDMQFTQEEKERAAGQAESVLEDLAAMMKKDNALKEFKRDRYTDSFARYYKEHKPVLAEFSKIYVQSGCSEAVAKKAAGAFLEYMEQEIASVSKRSTKESKVMDASLVLVVYVLPAMQEYKGQAMEALSDCLVALWRERFPKNQISKSTFEQINGGFKRKLCYITTAVCESLGKEDDCMELNLLRRYRDQYLMHSEEGAKIIEGYYDIAPTIVNRINKQADSAGIYQEIWECYLKKCVSLIQSDRKEECKEVYSSMVNYLTKEYVIQ